MSAGTPGCCARSFQITLCSSAGKSNATDCWTLIDTCVGVNVFACIVTTAATEPDVTVTTTASDVLPLDVAVIDAEPVVTPSTRPVELTLTTFIADDVYVIFALGSVTPLTSRAVAVSCTGSPTAIVCFG